jgi:hypothetical protein
MNPTKPRMLFNGDAQTFFRDEIIAAWQPEGGAFSPWTIFRYIEMLASHGIDALLINVNTQIAWYPSRVWPTVLDTYERGNSDYQRPSVLLDRYLDLREAGVDWLAEACRACRQFGVAPWVSVRMNDLHGHPDPTGHYLMRESRFADPAWRLSGRCLHPKDGAYIRWSGLNYGLPHVRAHMGALIGELLADYDVDGIELDWWREPRCCEYPALEADRQAVTDWHIGLRELTRARAMKSGRPCLVSLRGPQNLGLLRSIGLDVAAIARGGGLDIFCPGNHWQTSWEVDVEGLRRQLGAGVSVYGVVDDAPNWIEGRTENGDWSTVRYLSGSPELLRGNAANKWAAGVDGLEFFNFFCTDSASGPSFPTQPPGHLPIVRSHYEAIPSLSSLAVLRGEPKQYAVATVGSALHNQPFDEVNQPPLILPPLGKGVFRLTMCAEPDWGGLELVIQIIVTKTDRLPELGVGFNGAWPIFTGIGTQKLLFPVGDVVRHTAGHTAFNFQFSPGEIAEGWNTITVWNSGHAAGEPREPSDLSVTVAGVECAVRKKGDQKSP